MKKLFLFLLVLPLAFMACSSDDDKEPGEEDLDKMTIEEYMSKDRKFKWTGDWNDPTDPLNTNPNKDKVYNPIKGYWKGETAIVFYYSEDFEFIRYRYDKAEMTLTFIDKVSYIINNRTYRYLSNSDNFPYGISTDDKTLYYHESRVATEGDEISKKDWDKMNRFDASGLKIK